MITDNTIGNPNIIPPGPCTDPFVAGAIGNPGFSQGYTRSTVTATARSARPPAWRRAGSSSSSSTTRTRSSDEGLGCRAIRPRRGRNRADGDARADGGCGRRRQRRVALRPGVKTIRGFQARVFCGPAKAKMTLNRKNSRSRTASASDTDRPPRQHRHGRHRHRKKPAEAPVLRADHGTLARVLRAGREQSRHLSQGLDHRERARNPVGPARRGRPEDRPRSRFAFGTVLGHEACKPDLRNADYEVKRVFHLLRKAAPHPRTDAASGGRVVQNIPGRIPQVARRAFDRLEESVLWPQQDVQRWAQPRIGVQRPLERHSPTGLSAVLHGSGGTRRSSLENRTDVCSAQHRGGRAPAGTTGPLPILLPDCGRRDPA